MKCPPNAQVQLAGCFLLGGVRTARHGSPPAGSCWEDWHLGKKRVTGRFQASEGTPTSSLLRQGLVVGTLHSTGLASWQDCTIV